MFTDGFSGFFLSTIASNAEIKKFVDNIVVDTSGQIEFEELSSKLKNESKDIDKGSVRIFLRRLFPNVKFKAWRSKLDLKKITTLYQGDIILTPEDHSDFVEILNKVIPECQERLKVFPISQQKAIESHPKGRRWNKDILRICLSLWCRSPRGYADLRASGFVVLLSSRLLQYYKNSVNQVSGVNKEMLSWMLNEANNKNIPLEGYERGILLDEMSIESDIQFSKKGGGVTGFRFPFAHFATTGAPAYELYLTFWKAVNMLSLFDFKVTYLSMDGAQSNKDFINTLLGKAETETFTISNVFDSDSTEISVIMDFSHAMNKIRNSIYKSGLNNCDKRNTLLKD
ncbi:unnamed protein product [Mytilus coruscus]|uniref:EF-hand domain-containing protein n=1 Tax=Mytilus coruscus TaxID=42192 RepID=A0A6J8EPP4_MYTCO|nr:unnamed protein product [Mytilus coruscus]